MGTSEGVLTSTHKLCFGAKLRKKVYPYIPQFYYNIIKVGRKGVYITRTCFHDDLMIFDDTLRDNFAYFAIEPML